MSDRLKIAIPNKGRLSDRALELLSRAGFHVPRHARRLTANVNDRWQLLFVRTKDIPEYVATGTADAGMTGEDVVAEQGLHVETLLGLGFGKCRLVIAAPKSSEIKSLVDMTGLRIATVFPKLTERHFRERGIEIEIIPLTGATEVAPQVGVAEAIVDLVETGSTLKQHGLVEIETIMNSEAVVIANPESLKSQISQLDELKSALKSVLDAQTQRYLMLNLPHANLEEVKELLPGVTSPTVMDLLERKDWVAVHAVVDENSLNQLIPALKAKGAEGLLVLPIERMIS